MMSLDSSAMGTKRQLNSMMGEFTRYKQVVEQHSKKLRTAMLALHAKTDCWRDEKNKTKALLQDLIRSVDNQQGILEGRQ